MYPNMSGVTIPTITPDDVQDLLSFIKQTSDDIGYKGVVIGISGGIEIR